MKFMGALDARHVVRAFHHADNRTVAARVRAGGAGILLSEVVADAAQLDFVFYLEDRASHALCFFARGAFDVKGDALGGFLTDSGEPLEFIDQAVQRAGEYAHGVTGARGEVASILCSRPVGERVASVMSRVRACSFPPKAPGLRPRYVNPGIFSPPVRFPTRLASCSSTLRPASLTAATTK